MARPRKVVTENQRRSIVSRYAKGDGFADIGKDLELTAAVIRRTLTDNNVTIRGRGRPKLAVEA